MSTKSRADRRAQERRDRRARNDPAVHRFVAKQRQQTQQREMRLPLTDQRVTDLMTFVHSSIDAVSKGGGKSIDIVNMACMVDVSMLLAQRGLGSDYIADIQAAQAAVQAVLDRFNERQVAIFTGAEMQVVNAWCDIHDAQMNAAPADRPTEAEISWAVQQIYRTDNGRRLQEVATP